MASGTQRTDGGGEPRPIRGTFSYRGFPPKRAVWFLQKKMRQVTRIWLKFLMSLSAPPQLFFFDSHVLRHWGIGDSRGGRVQAGLAAHAAAVAAEAVHVGVVRVLRP